MSEETLVYLDGRFVDRSEAVVSVFDQGLLFGDGLFEGIRAYNGQAVPGRQGCPHRRSAGAGEDEGGRRRNMPAEPDR